MDSILIALYNHFYRPPELPELKHEIKACRKRLVETLDKQERKLVLQIVDAQDKISDDLSADSFICGFKFGLQLSEELRHCNRKKRH